MFLYATDWSSAYCTHGIVRTLEESVTERRVAGLSVSGANYLGAEFSGCVLGDPAGNQRVRDADIFALPQELLA